MTSNKGGYNIDEAEDNYVPSKKKEIVKPKVQEDERPLTSNKGGYNIDEAEDNYVPSKKKEIVKPKV